VGNAIAGDWVKVNDVFYTIITTSPTVASDFLLIGNVTQLQLQSKTVSWAQVTDKSSIFEITDVYLHQYQYVYPKLS
jgi:hypothetical protein